MLDAQLGEAIAPDLAERLRGRPAGGVEELVLPDRIDHRELRQLQQARRRIATLLDAAGAAKFADCHRAFASASRGRRQPRRRQSAATGDAESPGHVHHVLAVRGAGAWNSGDFIRQREVRVGGEESGSLNSFGLRDLPVRGFDLGTLRGQRAVIGSIEYRFPLYEIDRGPTTYPIFFNRIHGAVFSDAGHAAGTTIASAGAEVAADFIVAGAVPLRYRLGVAVRLTNPGKSSVQPYIGLGSSF